MDMDILIACVVSIGFIIGIFVGIIIYAVVESYINK